MAYRAIIVEDEAPARRLIKKFVETDSVLEIIAEYDNGFDGVKGINELKPDIVFLDVQMPKLNGFEVAELLDCSPHIIFTTAFDQYAIKAFEINAVDYLLKPFSKDRLLQAVKKVELRLGGWSEPVKNALAESYRDGKKETLERIAVKAGNKIRVIQSDDIFFIRADDDYTHIHTRDKSYMKEKTMKYFETFLNADVFVRCHRSFIVNVTQIIKLEKYGKESYIAVLSNSQTVAVSANGYRNLKDYLHL